MTSKRSMQSESSVSTRGSDVRRCIRAVLAWIVRGSIEPRGSAGSPCFADVFGLRLLHFGAGLLAAVLLVAHEAAACSLQFTSPARGSTVHTANVSVTGTGSGTANPGDQGTVTATLNGVVIFQRSGTFTTLLNFFGSGAASVTLRPGANYFQVSGSAGGCSASDSMVVYHASKAQDDQTRKNGGDRNTCNGTNPVNSGTGNKFQVEVDYQGGGAFPLRLARYFNSAFSSQGRAGSQWRTSYDRSIRLGGSEAAVERPDGQRWRFTGSGTGVWAPAQPDTRATLERLANGGWRLVLEDSSTETYDGQGRLTVWSEAGGLTQTLTYDAAGQVSEVTHSSGRSLRFTYDSRGRLAQMTDPAGQVATYTYGAFDNLLTVTYPGNAVRRYHYETSTHPTALTGITDENGVRHATFGFDAQGRASQSGHAGGVGRVQITYNTDGSTTLLDALGAQRQETFVTIQDVVRRDTVAQGGATARLSHDANGNVVSYRDFNGHLSCYSHDSARNLETRRVQGLTGTNCPGTPVAGVTRTISTEWHASWRLPRRIAEPLRLSTYAFHGDAGASCAPAGASTALVCRRTEQATTDADGSLGFAATLSGAPRVWAYTYNARGQVLSVDGPRTDVADTTTYAYHTATTADFRAGDLQSITNALGHVTRFTRYDAHGRVRSLIDPNGVASEFAYDARGRLATRSVGGQTTRFDHDPNGQLRRITLPDGSYVHYTYDSARRPVEIADNLGNRRVLTRDDAGNVTREVALNADGSIARQQTRVFDTLGRLLQDLGAAGQSTVFGHDAQGNPTAVQDPRHSATNPIVTALAWDALGRLSRITAPHPPGGHTQFGHDGRDQLTRVVAPNNATTTYTVDGLGNLTREVSPDRGTTHHTFDAAGNARTRTDARGISASYTYDALDRLTGITYPGAGENVSFTWDSAAGSPACTNGLGRLCQVSDAGGSTRYAYDARGNLTQTVRTELGVVYTTGYSYDAADRLATLSTPTGHSFSVERDALGRVQRIAGTVAGVPTVFVQQVAYSAEGQVRSLSLGNGLVQTTGFDADGRATSGATSGTGAPGTGAYRSAEDDIPLPPWALALLGGALLLALLRRGAQRQPQRAQRLLVWLVLGTSSLSWTLAPGTAYAFDTQRQYDAAGNLISRTHPGGTTTFAYDKLNRLASEAGPARTQSFTWDANGNRLADGAGSYTVAPNSNRYATIRGASATYDAAGNLTTLATGTPPTTKTFTYNQAGRLREVRQGATLLATYAYNAFAQRTRKTLTAAGAQALGLPAAALTIVYHYDLAGNLLAETTGTGVPIRTYVWREGTTGALASQSLATQPLASPIAQIEHANNVHFGGSNGTAAEFVLYFVVDALATPREAKNQAGQAVWRWASDAFGSTLPNEDPDGDGRRTIVNLRFPGQYFDAEAGLHYNWHRTYDAASGRYLESDPIGLEGGINSYLYANAAPTMYADPNGLTPVGMAIRVGMRAIGGRAAADAIGAGARSLLGPTVGGVAACVLAGVCSVSDSASDDAGARVGAGAAAGSSNPNCLPDSDFCKKRLNYCISFCQYELDFPGRRDNTGPFRACIRRCMNAVDCDY